MATLKDHLNQFVPSEVCLQCDGCCRFKEENSAWQPKMGQEEIKKLINLRHSEERSDEESHQVEILRFAQNDRNISLADLISSKETFSKDGVIKTVSCHGEHLCSFFNPQDHACRIYSGRPFECRLYPFLINLRKGRVLLTVDLNCPYVYEKINSQEAKDYIAYLTNYLNSPKQLKMLKSNPQIIQAYEEVREVAEINLKRAKTI